MRWFPLLLVLVFGTSACSLLPSERSADNPDGPEIADVEIERIHAVESTPPPRDVAPEPRGEPPPLDELQPLAGNDPRQRLREAHFGDDAPATPTGRTSKIPAYRPPPEPTGQQAPMAGRVGIMTLIDNELRHVHAGTTPFGNHEQSYNVQYNFSGYVAGELREALLTRTPYQPVVVASTGALRRAAYDWHQTWDGEQFADTFQREFDGIIRQNRLDMLIIISYPTVDDGVFGSGQKLVGSGLYTRSFFGSTQAAVFSTLQFYRIAGTPARLVEPVSAPDDRNIGDLPNANLPDELENMPSRYLGPVYQPLRQIVQNKIQGLVSLPRKLGH
jgi:hypothetical protein